MNCSLLLCSCVIIYSELWSWKLAEEVSSPSHIFFFCNSLKIVSIFQINVYLVAIHNKDNEKKKKHCIWAETPPSCVQPCSCSSMLMILQAAAFLPLSLSRALFHAGTPLSRITEKKNQKNIFTRRLSLPESLQGAVLPLWIKLLAR